MALKFNKVAHENPKEIMVPNFKNFILSHPDIQ